jgi:platelet-activating factor acetylhydrolase IB subunit alpha
MTQILTSRQAEELYGPSCPGSRHVNNQTDTARRHKSIIAYLTANNLKDTATALRTELSLGEDVFDANTAKKYEGLLEKKWTSVVRLQKKVCGSEHKPPTASLTVPFSR